MKNSKRWLALGMAAMMMAAAAGCGSSTDTGADTGAAADAGSTEGGSVYYLNFKPEQDPQWQELAKAYTEETGVEVAAMCTRS